MQTNQSNTVARAIAEHPWSSLQDALLLSGGMIIAVVLALEYDLFKFGDQLTSEEHRLTLAELIFLTAVLAAGIFAFILRRLYENRSEAARQLYCKLEMQKLKDQTLHDPLTGLLNRRGLLSALASVTSDTHHEGRQHALLLLDLDDFKRVNDLHGHTVGDQVLKVIVGRFRAAARPIDILARLDGGDEFAVLAYDVDRDAAKSVGQRLIEALQTEVFVEGLPHKVGVSIGATMIPDQRMTATEILNEADLAMYRAKEEDQPALVFYDATDAPS